MELDWPERTAVSSLTLCGHSTSFPTDSITHQGEFSLHPCLLTVLAHHKKEMAPQEGPISRKDEEMLLGREQ